jgi:hypothetical protein
MWRPRGKRRRPRRAAIPAGCRCDQAVPISRVIATRIFAASLQYGARMTAHSGFRTMRQDHAPPAPASMLGGAINRPCSAVAWTAVSLPASPLNALTDVVP